MNKGKNIVAPSTLPNTKSILKFQDDEVVDTIITVPPDGGWGWVVVIGSFLCHFISDGTMYAFGIFVDDISNTFEVTATDVSTANSLMSGFYYLSGPVVSALTNRFGFRVVTVCGGILASTGIMIASFSTSFPLFLVSYGVIAALGFGMTYVPSIVVIGFYFERWRALATSLAVTGTSVAIIVLPLIMNVALVNLNWRDKFRILSVTAFLCGCCGLLYLPLKPKRIYPVDEKKVKFSRSNVAISPKKKKLFKSYHNYGYPTNAEVYGKTSLNTDTSPRRISGVSKVAHIPNRRYSRTSIQPTLSQISRIDDGGNKCTRCCRKCSSCCEDEDSVTTNRPFYRDDILYSASLLRVPEYKKTIESTERKLPSRSKQTYDYSSSVTRAATVNDMESDGPRCACCTEASTRILATMLNFSLLKSPPFIVLAFSGFFTVLGMYVPFTFLVTTVTKHGMTATTASYLISVSGVANTCGRILNGVLSSFPKVRALEVTYAALTISGISLMLTTVSYNPVTQFTCYIVYGLTICSFSALRSIIIVDIFGLEALTNAFGILMMFHGIACLIGIPLAGFLSDTTGRDEAINCLAGGGILFSAILLYPLRAISKKEMNKIQTENKASVLEKVLT